MNGELSNHAHGEKMLGSRNLKRGGAFTRRWKDNCLEMAMREQMKATLPGLGV